MNLAQESLIWAYFDPSIFIEFTRTFQVFPKVYTGKIQKDLLFRDQLRGGFKKSGTFGCCPPQNGLRTTFLWEFFFAWNPLIRKNNLSDLKVNVKVVVFGPKVVVGHQPE